MRALETSLANPHVGWSDLSSDIGHRRGIQGVCSGNQGGDGNRWRRLSGSRSGRISIVVVGLRGSRSRHARSAKVHGSRIGCDLVDRGHRLNQRGVHEPSRDSRRMFNGGGTLMAGKPVDLEKFWE